eukprot:Awhi_evm1s13525
MMMNVATISVFALALASPVLAQENQTVTNRTDIAVEKYLNISTKVQECFWMDGYELDECGVEFDRCGCDIGCCAGFQCEGNIYFAHCKIDELYTPSPSETASETPSETDVVTANNDNGVSSLTAPVFLGTTAGLIQYLLN